MKIGDFASKKGWIAGAIKRPGALRAKAKKAGAMKGGKIKPSWLEDKSKGNSRTAKQARLAEMLRGFKS